MIIVDVEASGLDPNKHGIVSIGAIDFDTPMEQFYGECRISKELHILDEAIPIAGFSETEMRDPQKQTDTELIEKFIDWAMKRGEHTFGGQNPSFDRDFLQATAHRAHLDWPFAYRTIDLHSICYMHMIKRGLIPPTEKNRSSLNSAKIMQYVGIPAEIKPHNSLRDAKSAGEALSRLLFDKKLLPEYEKYQIPWF
ncbi:MAG: 3'-5' exonuclease [Candidatus Paceibacterota bacterium]|jgi:DNA polymerase III epsilon subunit-like protein